MVSGNAPTEDQPGCSVTWAIEIGAWVSPRLSPLHSPPLVVTLVRPLDVVDALLLSPVAGCSCPKSRLRQRPFRLFFVSLGSGRHCLSRLLPRSFVRLACLPNL
jgi:hypothetical protein